MISHGGSNSVLECLSKGIPLALLPICNDQPFQAKFLERANVGIVLDAKNPDVAVYKSGLVSILADGNMFKKNAEIIKKSFENYNGVRDAADLICRLLDDGKPLKPEM